MTPSSEQPKWMKSLRKVGEPCALWFLCMLLIAGSHLGCTSNRYPYPVAGVGPQPGAGQLPGIGGGVAPTTTGPGSVFAQQVTSPQVIELQRRVQQLDDNNRELTTQLAQAQQKSQAFQERSDLLARQLQDLTNQNKQLLAASKQYASQAQGLQASMTDMRRGYESAFSQRGGARLTANNSLRASAAPIQIAGIQAVVDGDLVRLRIPADQLFAPGSANPNPSGNMVLDQLASAILRQYPRQRIAIEGHTDDAQTYGNYGSPYQLAGAQAQYVMDYLVRRNGVPMQQLFVIAHGPNHPLSNNLSPAARSENRRVEIVVYPETF